MDAAVLRSRNPHPFASARDADIGEAPFFFQPGAPAFVHRTLAGEGAFLPAGKENRVEFQSLGAVQRHNRDGIARFGAISIHDQGNMFKEPAQGVELLH